IDHGRAAVLPADSFDLDGDGDLEEAWPFDIAGLARVQGSHVDVGAYESPFSVATEDGVLPTTSVLEGAYPNPASTTATLELTVARAQRIRVEVLDLLGRTVSEVYEGNVAAGTTQALAIQAASLPAGLYFVRVRGEFFSATEPVTVAR
ncbi:MAG: T9SS type A sorting domain-containing protein, partial [Bacteroidota bacterium]